MFDALTDRLSSVFDRLSGAMDTMHRDFVKDDFPENMIVVSHGLTIRLFLMRWFHWTVEQFEKLRKLATRMALLRPIRSFTEKSSAWHRTRCCSRSGTRWRLG